MLVALVSTTAAAIPPTPTVYAPAADGGWTTRPPLLRAQLQPSIPLDVNRFEFEVQSPLDVTTAQQVVPVNRAAYTFLVEYRPPSPPDAGAHWWRARAIDDTGDAGAWMPLDWFRIDDVDPAYPATFTLAAQDGGFVSVACSPVTDSQSGLATYHWQLGQLDAPDGGPGTFFGGPSTTAPARDFRLGPGRWTIGAHTHDVANNSLPNSATWLTATVGAGTLGTPPAPLITQSNGMPWPSAPYQNGGRVYLRFPAQSFDAGAYVVLQSNTPDSGVWGWAVDSTGPTANVFESDGRYEFRYAALLGGETTDYSPAVFVWVDATRPLATARVDGGLDGSVVSLSWAPANDANQTTTGSGVGAYRVVRQGGDASVAIATVPASGALAATDTPPPGAWTYAVFSEDRALNLSSTAGRLAVVVPPDAPGAPRAASPTDAAVALTWDWAGDGGAASFELDRIDAQSGTVVAVLTAIPSAAFTDFPGEGRWQYGARAVVLGAASATSPAAAVAVVDQSPPVAPAPAVRRTMEREVTVSWSAADALTSVVEVRVERETSGVVSPLGVASAASFADAPPDGTHRYRVVATDEVGNAGTSPWSEPIDTPGAFLTIDPVGPLANRCGRTLSVTLTASGDGPVRWTLLEGPAGALLDESSGELSWTPVHDEQGPQAFRVRAEAASRADEKSFTVDVECERAVLGLGCGCASVDASWLGLAGLLLALRRRGRPPT